MGQQQRDSAFQIEAKASGWMTLHEIVSKRWKQEREEGTAALAATHHEDRQQVWRENAPRLSKRIKWSDDTGKRRATSYSHYFYKNPILVPLLVLPVKPYIFAMVVHSSYTIRPYFLNKLFESYRVHVILIR